MLNGYCKENQIQWTGVLDRFTAKLVLGQDYDTRPSHGAPTPVTSVSSLTPNSFLPHILLQSLIEPPTLSSPSSL